LRWKTYGANDSQLASIRTSTTESATLKEDLDRRGLLNLQKRMLWQYPFSAASAESAVKRISSLVAKQVVVVDEAQILFGYNQAAGALSRTSISKPSSKGLSAVDIGSAYHRFLEMVALEQVSRLEDLQHQGAQMLGQGVLTPEEVEALDFESLLAFWTSEVGQKILAQAASVHREIPFTARLSPEDFASLNLCPNAAELAGEYFVVRGKADLAVFLPKEIWLLDFKTDQITEPEADERTRHYAPQLKLYALGLSRIYRRPVTQRWLRFIGLNKTVSV
jgi:ATP-dependent helicase/nuclease subunit A